MPEKSTPKRKRVTLQKRSLEELHVQYLKKRFLTKKLRSRKKWLKAI